MPSSSGPTRANISAREGRRYSPLRSAKKKAKFDSDDWSRTFARFRAGLNALYLVHNGQPSGGVEPEVVLAEVDRLVKDDLKQSVSNFFYCVFFVISLICQPGNSHSGMGRPDKGNVPGMRKHTWRV